MSARKTSQSRERARALPSLDRLSRAVTDMDISTTKRKRDSEGLSNSLLKELPDDQLLLVIKEMAQSSGRWPALCDASSSLQRLCANDDQLSALKVCIRADWTREDRFKWTTENCNVFEKGKIEWIRYKSEWEERVFAGKDKLKEMVDLVVAGTSQVEESQTVDYGPIGIWDTSKVDDMSELFKDRIDFNEDIGGWNTSQVKKMNEMFLGAHSFNQDIGAWDTSQVEDMSGMFYEASEFNEDIGGWNTSKVKKMNGMFVRAYDFNQDIGAWDTSRVEDMEEMFVRAYQFNQDIGAWDTSNVKNMNAMFCEALEFNCDIGGWDTSNVEQMDNLFTEAEKFEREHVKCWDVSNVWFLGKSLAFCIAKTEAEKEAKKKCRRVKQRAALIRLFNRQVLAEDYAGDSEALAKAADSFFRRRGWDAKTALHEFRE
jgi:surface protein